MSGMRAMAVTRPGPIERHPLESVEIDVPEPGPGQLRVRVEACGVCRTDLHLAESDLAPRRPRVVPGHEVVGRVDALGPAAERFREGERVGVAWLHSVCGACRFCTSGRENLCTAPQFTGWDVDGGYAEYVVAPEAFVHPLPEAQEARDLAPLLCAGIVGYRAYTRCGVRPGGVLGMWGFGGSAHVTLQVAAHFGCRVHVFSRGDAHRELARELGAASVQGSFDAPPERLDAAILFAPAGDLVLPALEALDRGGVLAVAGIHLSEIPSMDYERHLFQERELRSVTSNTREDAAALLRLAAEIPIRTHTVSYELADATHALLDLKQDRVRGAAVLIP